MVWFAVRFVAVFLFLNWLFSQPPTGTTGRIISSIASRQIDIAAAILSVFGVSTYRSGEMLTGKEFSCFIGEGCNGMIAVALVMAGVLSFPVRGRSRVAGLFLLPPLVLLVNVLRIAGLYVAGARFPGLFNLVHVYVGQVVVIAVSSMAWWIWLNWAFRSSAAESRPLR